MKTIETITDAVENLARIAAVAVSLGNDKESAINVAAISTQDGARDVWRNYSGPATFGEWLRDNHEWAMTISVANDAEDGTIERPSVGNVRAAVAALIPGYVEEFAVRHK